MVPHCFYLRQNALNKMFGRKGIGENVSVGPSPYLSGDIAGQLNEDDLKEPC